MKYTVPPLPYAYNALEPYIDEQTMKIHHDKHHQAYVDKLNAVLEKYPNYVNDKLEDLMRNILTLDFDKKDAVTFQNNGGGHLNHSFFWQIMGPKKEVDEQLVERINKTFGSVDEFKKTFAETAIACFGSGWAWLVENDKKELEIYSTANQNSPYLNNHTPLIGLDVWEHAYYLKYQNQRAEYIKNWWNALKIL
jgi:Fe-Mn family superoxide dismutase